MYREKPGAYIVLYIGLLYKRIVIMVCEQQLGAAVGHKALIPSL